MPTSTNLEALQTAFLNIQRDVKNLFSHGLDLIRYSCRCIRYGKGADCV